MPPAKGSARVKCKACGRWMYIPPTVKQKQCPSCGETYRIRPKKS